MKGTEDFSALKPADEPFFHALHDGIVHNPLGAGSYVYENELAKPLLRYLGLVPASARFTPPQRSQTQTHANLNARAPLSETATATETETETKTGIEPKTEADPTSSTLVIHVGAQPNNSPHAGTLLVLSLAFILAKHLQSTYPRLRAHALALGSPPADWVDTIHVVVHLDLVDTAPDSARTTVLDDGLVYQHSHRATGAMRTFLPDYHALLAELAAFVGAGAVEYAVEYQEGLMRMPGMRDALCAIVADRVRLAGELAPGRETLAMRSACPVGGCGMADKHGVRNEYGDGVGSGGPEVTFVCPIHGPYTLALGKADDRARIELNTPLRNLARTMAYMADTGASMSPRQRVPERLHMRVTGADYSGMYQEQLLFRQLALLRDVAEPGLREAMGRHHPLFVYAPLITDWSGAKLSKSLYVRQDAYRYLDASGMAYLLEYRRMVEEGKDRGVLFRMVEEWVGEPLKLFRPYSIGYLHARFLAAARSTEDGVSKT